MKFQLFVFLCIVNQFVMYTQNKAQEVDLSELGIKFTVPEGWTGQQDGDYILLGHHTIPGLMILFQNTAKDAQSLKELAMQGIMEEGVSLKAREDFTIVSTTQVEGYYEGDFQGAVVTSFAMGLINSEGAGMNILSLTESDKFTKEHISEAKKLAKSITFTAPKESDATTAWKKLIAGAQLKYMYTSGGSDYGGGYSGIRDVVMINLCTNGQFIYYSNSNSSFDGSGGFGTVNSNENNHGTYRIYTVGSISNLELTFNSGDISTFELTRNEDHSTFLNGEQYFITDIEGCQ